MQEGGRCSVRRQGRGLWKTLGEVSEAARHWPCKDGIIGGGSLSPQQGHWERVAQGDKQEDMAQDPEEY